MNKLSVLVMAILVVCCHSQGLYVSIVDPKKQSNKQEILLSEDSPSLGDTETKEKLTQSTYNFHGYSNFFG